MPFAARLRKILHICNTPRPKFDFNDGGKWLDMGAHGYTTEGFVGHYSCPRCSTIINAYRSVLQNSATTTDFLRFEQAVSNGSGRVVMQVPITFEKEFVAMEGGKLLGGKVLGTPCKCEVVKEEFFASCTCVGCGETMAFWNQVKRCEEVGRLRWFLARKEKGKVLDGEEGDEKWEYAS